MKPSGPASSQSATAAAEAGLEVAARKLWFDYHDAIEREDWSGGDLTAYLKEMGQSLPADREKRELLKAPMELANGGLVESVVVERFSDPEGLRFNLRSTGAFSGVRRVAVQSVRVAGSLFEGFDYALLARNVNCIFCHADFDNVDRVSGQIVDAEQDPIVLKIPNGKIAYNHSEVAEIIFDTVEFQDPSIAGDSAATPEMPAAAPNELSEEDTAKVLQYLEELDKANDEEEDTGFNEERQRLVAELGGIGPGAAPLIEQALQEGNPESAPYCLAGLMMANPARGTRVATQTVEIHGSGSVRKMAVDLLAWKDPQAHAATLTRAAQDPQGHVRLAALNGLREAASPSAVHTLATALNDEVPQNRGTAILGLGEIAGRPFATLEEAATWYRNTYSPGK